MGAILMVLIVAGSFHYQEWRHKRALAECRSRITCAAPVECGHTIGWLEPKCVVFVDAPGCYSTKEWKQ